MARIVFYDATELDKQQLTAGLERTDHHWIFVDEKTSEANIDPEAEVISVFVSCEVTRAMIEAMPKLKLIACRSTGFNNIDFAAAEDHGVTVTNVPTYGEATVAEYAFTLLLALQRKLPQTFDRGGDVDQPALRGSDLNQKTLGVIGTGHIGQKAISIAKGFGMKVVAFDPFPNHDAATELGFSYAEFDEVIKTADAVTLHAPYTEQTHHIINANALEKMKQTAVLVNTARGELIDTKALIVALDEGQIAGAALDVIEGEALENHREEVALLRSDDIPAESLLHSLEIATLSKMDNVIVTPHNAFNTVEAIGRINATTAGNITDFWYGNIPNKVKPPQKAAGKLVLVRHTESEWNATGQWTGTRDVHLSEAGFREAALIGHEARKLDIKIDIAFCSQQIRTLETLEAILNATGQLDVPVRRSNAVNERDYGDYTGMNKWQVHDEIGEEQWNAVRRGWDVHVPNGETLKDVYERVLPYYTNEILPFLKRGMNVMLVAHGNSLRALIKYIEDIADEDVPELEMLFGDIVTYRVDDEGRQQTKDVLHVDFTELHDKYEDNNLEVSRNIG